MTVRMYGSLQKSGISEPVFHTPITVRDLIALMKISHSDVKLVMVNHRPVAADAHVSPGDSVALFPREYPFFADWKDYWSRYEG